MDDEIKRLWQIIRKQDEVLALQDKMLDWAHFVIEMATNFPTDWKSRVMAAMPPDRRGTYWIDYIEAALKDYSAA